MDCRLGAWLTLLVSLLMSPHYSRVLWRHDSESRLQPERLSLFPVFCRLQSIELVLGCVEQYY